MDEIERAQYANLRKCFYDIVLTPILGKNYYNMGMDVYQSDLECCKDIKREYDNLKTKSKIYRDLSICMTIIALISTTVLLFR